MVFGIGLTLLYKTGIIIKFYDSIRDIIWSDSCYQPKTNNARKLQLLAFIGLDPPPPPPPPTHTHTYIDINYCSLS